MGIVFRQSVKATIIVMGGTVIGALTVYFSSHILPKNELGFRTNLLNQGVVLQFFILMGVNNTLTAFLPRYHTESVKGRVLFTTGVLVAITMTLLLCIPYFAFQEQIIDHFQMQDRALIRQYYALLPMLVIFWGIITHLEAYLIAASKTAISSFIKEFILKIVTLLILLIYELHVMSFTVFISCTVVAYAFAVFLMALAANRLADFGLSFEWQRFNRAEWVEIGKYSWYHLLAGMSVMLVGFLDQIILAPLDHRGMESVAVYNIAVFIATVALLPMRTMASAAFPVLNRAFLDDDMPLLTRLFRRSGINMLIAGMGMCLLILCNLRNGVRLLPAGFDAIIPLVSILLVGRFTDLATGLNSEILSISSHYKFLFRISAVLAILLVLSCRLLIPHYGVYGAAWSAAGSLAVFNIAKMVFIWYKFRLQPFTVQSLYVMLAGILAGCAGYLFPRLENLWVDAILRSLCVLGAYLSCLLILKPSEDLSSYLQSVRARKRFF